MEEFPSFSTSIYKENYCLSIKSPSKSYLNILKFAVEPAVPPKPRTPDYITKVILQESISLNTVYLVTGSTF